ncbi:hypothetical protein ACFVZD_27345 [Streptomyces sp. NPDC058287]|uniref:helix-turn-helix transcriptional regulator n=1 Tax=unclassified Streptomyces TaxID=2593676 RepID=UPI0036EB5CCD
MMKTELQAARLARGWTQAELMVAMEDAAERLGIELPSRSSLKTQVSMFENGRRPPGPEYQSLLCEVYEATRHQLGFELETAPSQLDALPKLPRPQGPAPTASSEVLGYLKSVFVQHAQAEPLVGPRFLVPAVQSQVPLIEQLCTDAKGPARGEVLRVGLRYAEFLGWLYQDSGDSQEAMLWTNRALDYAYELDDPTLSAYVFQRRANIATEAGRAGYAQGLANAALNYSGKIPSQIEAVALRARANAHAELGNASETARALDEARVLAAKPPGDDDGLAPYVSVEYIDMEAANCAIVLNRPEDAVTALRREPHTVARAPTARPGPLPRSAGHGIRAERGPGGGGQRWHESGVYRAGHRIGEDLGRVDPTANAPRAVQQAGGDCRTQPGRGQYEGHLTRPEESCEPASHDHDN